MSENVEITAEMEQFISYVEKLSVLELSKLVKALEDRLGVSAAAPVAVAAAPAAGAAPAAAAEVYKYIRRGGSFCELGFFTNNGDTTYSPHLDMCNK